MALMEKESDIHNFLKKDMPFKLKQVLCQIRNDAHERV